MHRLVLTILCAWGSIRYGDCRKLHQKIVGGQNTTIEQYPYQLSLLKYGSHFCGATLVKDDVVLTTAHCVENVDKSVSDLAARAGSTYRNEGGVVINVKKICSHPKFTINYDYDVAVLQLEKPYQLSSSIKSIPLQSRGDHVPAGAMGTATGWGALIFDGPPSYVLQEVDVPKIKPIDCENFYLEEIVTPRMDCYGYKEGNKDVCHGDSGGPVVVNGKVSGISSWGYGCAFPNRPNVYTVIANQEINDFVTKFLKDSNNFVNC
ncbi:hypothetical protein FQR65_LT07298 [Abscondita terminalis]|nr:hypothetical protein FQR65_LT07298 [Abscondita terminalis]